MDLYGGSLSTVSTGAQAIPGHSTRDDVFYQFTQQNLPSCKPVLTPAVVIATLLLMGFIFIPVFEIVDRYHIDCVPEEFRSNKVLKPMKAPIYIYYQLDNYYQNQLDNYYQNHRRKISHTVVGPVEVQHLIEHSTSNWMMNLRSSIESSHDLPIVPCGLMAWSLFNDTYTFSRSSSELKNGTFIGGGKLDPSIPLLLFVRLLGTRPSVVRSKPILMARCVVILARQREGAYSGITHGELRMVEVVGAKIVGDALLFHDCSSWLFLKIRTAPLPTFRKLYGRIEEDLDVDDVIVVHLENNYSTYSFGGKKKLVLSTLSWLGGKNDFLGVANLFVGAFCILISIIFLLLHVKNPRPYGDTAYISWNRKNIAS
ncbi:hypothetical protein JHK87_042881 [Glycine soja]|nr:hypothetical protein JHK87_042881 [Glycine soja]